MIYLTGFIFAKSWREQCAGQSEYQVYTDVTRLLFLNSYFMFLKLKQLKQDVIDDPEDPTSVLVS